MKLDEFCIRRPAFTIVISLLFIVLGLACYQKLSLRYLPSYVVPVVSISTDYPSASSDIVETQVTSVLEDAMSGIHGLQFITSQSSNGSSQITLTFKLGTDLNVAAEDVRANVAKIVAQLPPGIEPPQVSKTDPNANPILFFAYADPQESIGALTDYIKKTVVPQFEASPGVAKVYIWSSKFYAMRVWLDPAKMAASGVTVDDVENIINNQNVAVPTGTIENNQLLYNVTTDIKLHNPAEFGNLVIKNQADNVVRLKDIASIEVGDEHRTSDTAMRYFAVNGNPGVAIGIVPEEDANSLAVTSAAIKLSQRIASQLPQGVSQVIEYNQSDFTQADLNSIYTAIIEAIAFILAVIILFLGSWRAALIPIITIPISLLGTFAFIFLLGYSINTITLLALVLAIGLVVDDAIIMVENISRYREQGYSAVDAAIKGSQQISTAIIAVTIVLAAAYAPVGFVTGISGVFFQEFAFTLLSAVLISGVIALTLSPMMCAHFLTAKHPGRYQVWLDKKFSQIKDIFQQGLKKLLVNKIFILLAVIILVTLGAATFYVLPKQLAPNMNMPLVNVFASLPAQNSYAKTESYIPFINNTLSKDPAVADYLTQLFGGSDAIYVATALKPQQNSYQVAAELQAKFTNIPGIKITVASVSPPITWSLPSTGAGDINISFMTTGSYLQLQQTMTKIMGLVQQNKNLVNVDDSLKWDTQQIHIDVNRDLISDLNVPMNAVTDTLTASLGGMQIGKYDFENQSYDVIMQLPPDVLTNINIINKLYVRNAIGEMIPLSNFITTTHNTAPASLTHYNRLRSDTLSAAFAPGYSMGEAIQYFENLLAKNLPDNISYAFVGQAQQYLESSDSMLWTFVLSLVLIYLILVAQFEDFIDPFIILSCVPFAIIGALFALKLTGNSLNLYSEIGLVTLIGLITKHGILITEFANQLMRQGKTVQQAVIEATSLRLRPILMTTLAMILGALPLALASGPGSENRQQIAWVIIGGLLIGTFISLIVVPTVYYVVNGMLRRRRL